MMNNTSKRWLLPVCTLLPLAAGAVHAEETSVEKTSKDKHTRPNIVVILSDDAGYNDFGFQGSKQFKTPNLDKLAKSGMVMKQMYVTAAVSGPSRAGLMTGQFSQRFGIEENNVVGIMSPHGETGFDMGVPTNIKTIGNYLQDAGYKTAAYGKWHLGSADRFHPYRRGFDHFVGFRSGARKYFAYKKALAEEQSDKKLEYGFAHFREPEEYMTTLLAKEACQFMEREQENPFFIYLAFNAVHGPLDYEKKDLKQFPNLKGKRQRLAAMTLSLDNACGMVMDKLKELDLDKNTLVIFTNDNGGPSDNTTANNYPLAGHKATHLEGGLRVPGIFSFPGVIKPNTTYDYPVSTLDFLPTFLRLAEVPGDAKMRQEHTDSIANLDGVDIMPYLTGKIKERPHETLYWRIENRGTVRYKDWKFMRFPDRPCELYDLSKDIGEQNNLASEHPELVKNLYKKLFDWEMQMQRPRYMLKRKYEAFIMNTAYQDEFRVPKEPK